MGLLTDCFGIDFGTTNSAVVSRRDQDGNIVFHQHGSDYGLPMPSSIAIDRKTGEVYSGRRSWEKRSELAERCEYIRSVKSLLDDDDGAPLLIDGNDKRWTPVDVASEIFKALKKLVRNSHERLDRATVAIPITFSPTKRRKLRQAAAMAGIEITSFISEPTAAFFANYDDLRSCSTIAVFDWGGGTLDVSVLKHSGGAVEELAVRGMSIAGDHIDMKMARHIHSMIARDRRSTGIAFEDIPARQRDYLIVASERAKKEFSGDDEATVAISEYGDFGTLRKTLIYDWFAEIIRPEVDAAVDCLKKAVKSSKVGINNIDVVLMVGGTSGLRPLREAMEQIFADRIYMPENKEWNIAMGAAKLRHEPGEHYAAQSLGVNLSSGAFYPILSRGTPLKGFKASCDFGIVDSSEEARFIFSDGDERAPLCLKSLSVPAYRFLYEKIKLDAEVDDNLVFTVYAKSERQSEDFTRFWEYDGLRCGYRISK
ncbi:MAG: Hsp70 family protein [Synergistaceae bacterium]|jgi:molecular chaperone DnaK|nr:Hsp70 family protein [Synergistaceae bacterium]